MAGFQWSSQLEQMASINVVAPDRSSLDSFHFLNDTLVCKCIVYQVVTNNLSNYCESSVCFMKKLSKNPGLEALAASFVLILAYFHQVSLKWIFPSPSLHDAPSDTSCWHLDWTLMIPSSRVFMFDRHWEERVCEEEQQHSAQWFEKYAKICETLQKIHLSWKMKLQAQNLV